MNRHSKVETALFHNSLVCVVKALEGQCTTIDLRNEACVTGRITSVDGYMNVDMKNATYFDPRGNEFFFDTFFVQSRNIVYVHIPDGTSSGELIQNYLDSGRTRRPAKDKPHTFKKKRAERYHAETLSLLKQKSWSSKK